MDNFIKIENKLKEFFKTEQTYKIYKELRIEKNTYYSMRSRKSIPYKKIIELCLRKRIDLNYIFDI